MKLSIAIIAVAFAAALLLAGCVKNTPNMTQKLCESSGGRWGCEPCRAAPGENCLANCVSVCECGGGSGYKCPLGHYCTDYWQPVGADASGRMGVCRESNPANPEGDAATETVVLRSPRGDFADPGPVETECLRMAQDPAAIGANFTSCALARSSVGRSDAECGQNGYSPAGCSVCVLKCTLATGKPACGCTKELVPVCGEDNKTYPNKCYAACANVQVAFTGECSSAPQPAANGTANPAKCGGESNVKCPAGYRCEISSPINVADAMGVCVPDTDEMTQALCESAHGNYGVNLFGEATCSCGGFAGFGCPNGYRCIISETGVADAMGACRKVA